MEGLITLLKARRGRKGVRGESRLRFGRAERRIYFGFDEACRFQQATGINVFDPEAIKPKNFGPLAIRAGLLIGLRGGGSRLTDRELAEWIDATPGQLFSAVDALSMAIHRYLAAHHDAGEA